MEKKNIKVIVDRIGRKEIASFLKWPYGTLSGKLNGYVALSPEQEDEIRKACDYLTGNKCKDKKRGGQE
jgi:hypothetical protein